MTWLLLTLLSVCPQDADRVLFDFEKPEEAQRWSNLVVADPSTADPRIRKEPPATWSLSTENATRGEHSLKITFEGGRWPTITTALPPEDWTNYQNLSADITVTRPCLIGLTVLQEKSSRKEGWAPVISRWTKTIFAQPGRNALFEPLHRNDWQAILPKLGPVVALEIFMYAPHPGESVWIDNVRLGSERIRIAERKTEFRVAGTDWVVSGVAELGKKLKDRWTPPAAVSVDHVEADFRARYEALQKNHPKAVFASFRDGENGYQGWTDAYFNSHGPDGMTFERSENGGKRGSAEMFMRHRSPVHRVDLSSIPKGAAILAARLLICRDGAPPDAEHDPSTHPTMWVVEPCNRPWIETEVNAYEYAKDKFWREIGGQWYGEDPDFLPLYLAYGPAQGRVSHWDFTEAVRFWTSGEHGNHGFMLHGDGKDWMGRACFREHPDVRSRPALLVIYEEK